MRYYSSIASISAIANTAGLAPSDTYLVLSTSQGFPTSFPFTLRISPSTPKEELVEVSSGFGTQADPYIVIRGIDGTTAQTQPPNATVTHSFSARDFQEPQDFMDSYTGQQRVVVLRPTADTSPINNTTYVIDPYLQFYAEANTTYYVTLTAAFLASQAGDIKSNWLAPAGAQGGKYSIGIQHDQNSLPQFIGIHFNVYYPNFNREVYLAGAGTDMEIDGSPLRETLIIRTNENAGDVAFEWGQLVAHATPVTILPFAMLTYEVVQSL